MDIITEQESRANLKRIADALERLVEIFGEEV